MKRPPRKPVARNTPAYEASRGELEALVARMLAARWLAPDAGLDLLAAGEREWLEARHDEFSAALGGLPQPVQISGSLEVSRSADAVNAKWSAQWNEARRSSHNPSMLQSLTDALRGGDPETVSLVTPELRSGLNAELTRVASLWSGPLPAQQVHLTPALCVIDRHSQWMTQHGIARASDSPWCALLEVWMRGAWPVVLPDGGWIVFVPMWKDGRGVPDPARESPLPVVDAGAPGYADALESLGFGPPPRVIRLPNPVRNYFMFQLPAALMRNLDKVPRMAGVYQFNILGEGSWSVDLVSDPPRVVEEMSFGANVTIESSASDFESLMANPQDAMRLFFAGRLKFKGNQMLGVSLQKLLNLR